MRVIRPAWLNARLLPQTFATLRARHPALQLSLLEAEPPEAVAHVKAGQADVAVIYTFDGVPPAPEPVLEIRPLARDPLRVVLPGEHVLAQRSSVALGDLADETWIAGEPEATCTLATLHACHDAGFAPDIELRTGDFTTACALVAAGLGVALVPALALPAHVDGIRCLPITRDPVARHIHAALRPNAADEDWPLHADALQCLSEAAASPIA